MSVLSSKEKAQFIDMIQRIPDDKVRYFYLMLGSALAVGERAVSTPQANTSASHLADLQARFNR